MRSGASARQRNRDASKATVSWPLSPLEWGPRLHRFAARRPSRCYNPWVPVSTWWCMCICWVLANRFFFGVAGYQQTVWQAAVDPRCDPCGWCSAATRQQSGSAHSPINKKASTLLGHCSALSWLLYALFSFFFFLPRATSSQLGSRAGTVCGALSKQPNMSGCKGIRFFHIIFSSVPGLLRAEPLAVFQKALIEAWPLSW